MTIDERIRKRKIGIVGMARSGLAAAALAQSQGGEPFVSDGAPADKLVDAITELKRLDLPFETGGHSERLLGCDYLVLSPGVPIDADIIQRAQKSGIPIFSELEFASWICPGRIVAITGSNGKTTTTTLTGEILAAGGLDTHVCGNIGRPFADAVLQMTRASVAVVEVSSFQLETIEDFHPHAAAILNLTPDHIDRHGSFDAYKKAKYRITENQGEQDFLILNRDDKETIADAVTTLAERAFFSIERTKDCAAWVADSSLWVRREGEAHKIIACDEIAIRGPHNLQNAAAAAAIAVRFDVSNHAIAKVLASFPGVEHRMEQVGSVAGIAFVNDSKATNVDSVCYALRSISSPIYLIAGGRDKDGDFRPIIEHGRDRIKGIFVIGEAAEKLFDTLGRDFPVELAESLELAVQKTFAAAHPGETVLLSPGCASFDMFDNFEHRGRAFKSAVSLLKNGKATNETAAR